MCMARHHSMTYLAPSMAVWNGGRPNQRQWCIHTCCKSLVNVFIFLTVLTGRHTQIIGIKLFAVSPSEMCDKCTAFKMSAFNTARRNGLSGLNIIRMAQLQQYWTGGIGQSDSKYTHTVHLNLPKPQSQPTSITLPAPTLHDLLNPAPTDTLNDPYGAELLDDDDDEAPVHIFRSGMLERLDIDKLVNLAEPKLITRFSPSERPVLTWKSPSTQPPPKPVAEEWSAANSQWATKPFSFWPVQVWPPSAKASN